MDYEPISYRAGSDVANAARNGLTSSISKISDIINSDIDTQPTIRPVLDLSDVESGAVRLSSLLNNRDTILAGARSGSLARSIDTSRKDVSIIASTTKDPGHIQNLFNIANLTVRGEDDVKESSKATL